MITGKKKQAMIHRLKKEWNSGKRWGVYKNIEQTVLEELKCFKTYRQADRFCEENKRFGDPMGKIADLTGMIRKLQAPRKGNRTATSMISKSTLCEKYPLLSFPMSMDGLAAIPEDVYFPVVWSRVINPITDISQWLVTLAGRPNTILYQSPDYYPVLDHFMKRTDIISMMGIREELKLQAKIAPAPFDMYVELYRYYFHSKRGCYLLDKRTDGSKPFLLPITYFARYNGRSQRFEFFDGGLKRVQAGKIVEEMDVQYYDMGL